MSEVELTTAFAWWCEDCAERNFEMPRKAELTDDEAEEAYRQYHDLESYAELPENWREFEIIQIPSKVVCRVCGCTYTTKDERKA